MKTLKYGAMLLAVMLSARSQVSAFTVNWDAASTTELTLANKTTGLPIGSLVLLGNFGALTDPNIQAIGANPTGLLGAFQTWASTTIGTGTSTDPDGVGTFQTATTSPGAGFFSEQAYLLVFNTSSANTASQVGVFKGPTTGLSSGDAWTFPASDVSGSPTFSVADFTSLSGVLIGSFGVQTFNSPWLAEPVNALALAVVPEPSTWMLVGSGILGMFAIRRRKQKV